MQRYGWFIACAIIFAYCCNSTKKVINDPVKTNKVVAAWLKNNPLKVDTTYRYIPGDTVTQLLVAYDTTTVHDTTAKTIEKVITKTNTITRTVHDTVQVTTIDNRLLQACQNNFRASDNALQEQKMATGKANLKADKWVFRFWLLAAVAVLLGLLGMKFKFI